MVTIVALGLTLLAAVLVGGSPAVEAGGITAVGGSKSTRHPGHRHHASPHGSRIVVVPRPVYLTPRQCWAPGAWSYQWVPQSQVYYQWVPGHYNTDALWVEGHYAPRALQSGYWQPIWIEGRWVAC